MEQRIAVELDHSIKRVFGDHDPGYEPFILMCEPGRMRRAIIDMPGHKIIYDDGEGRFYGYYQIFKYLVKETGTGRVKMIFHVCDTRFGVCIGHVGVAYMPEHNYEDLVSDGDIVETEGSIEDPVYIYYNDGSGVETEKALPVVFVLKGEYIPNTGKEVKNGE